MIAKTPTLEPRNAAAIKPSSSHDSPALALARDPEAVAKARELIDQRLEDHSLMWRASRLLLGLLWLGVSVAGVVLLAVALYAAFRPGLVVAISLWTLLGAAIVVIGWRWIVRPLTARHSAASAALDLEANVVAHRNRLINAVQFAEQLDSNGKDGKPTHSLSPLGEQVARSIVVEGGVFVKARERELRQVVRWRPVAIAGGLLAAIALILAVLIAAAGDTVQRATTFMVQLSSDQATLELDVAPAGDITLYRGDDLEITVMPATGQSLPQGPLLLKDTLASHEEGEGDATAIAVTSRELRFNGNVYTYTYKNIERDFTWAIHHGADRTIEHTVRVLERPAVESIDVRLIYPEYTQLPPLSLRDASGDVEALAGTRVVFAANTTLPCSDVTLRLTPGGAHDLKPHTTERVRFFGEFTVTEDTRFTISLRGGEDGNVRGEPFASRTIRVLPDALPRVEILEPAGNMSLPAGARAIVRLRVSDDLGVAEVTRTMQKNGEPLPALTLFPADGAPLDDEDGLPRLQMARTEAIELPADQFRPGDRLTIIYTARDRNPDRDDGEVAQSRALLITILNPSDSAAATMSGLLDVIARIVALIDRQVALQTDATDLRQAIAARSANAAMRENTLAELSGGQRDVRAEALEIAALARDPAFARKQAADVLEDVAAGPAAQAIELVAALIAESADRGRDDAGLAALDVEQSAVIAVLRALLTELNALEDVLRSNPDPEDLENFNRASEDLLSDLSEKLDEFIDRQRKVVRMLEELDRMGVDDWSEDEELVNELRQVEELARFFRDLAEDLSKLPDQDFSSSQVVSELIEIYEEIQLADEALYENDITIAVEHEAAGLELAEEIEHNIERWLPDHRDNIQWQMEEPTEDYDVPLSDLPSELEDIIGDLIEDEDDLSEDAEDMSSSWMDNLDEGAGWGASDGPISNMSARGVTGNTLPNNNEVGGRSGEGRTGRSHGQHVEETATGKGGRETPTRLNPDPFEEGEVNDTSTDPMGGSTGGGKISGQGGEGLRGQPPPETQAEMQRLAQQQADIMNRAESLHRELERRHYPTTRLESAIEEMQTLIDDADSYEPADYRRRITRIMTSLREMERDVRDAQGMYRDRSRNLPEELRDEITSAQGDLSPEEYQELLDRYYRRLMEAGDDD